MEYPQDHGSSNPKKHNHMIMPHQRARNATRPQSPTAPTDTHRFAIRIAYNGALYQGFQSQTYGNTIQDQLEHRLHNLLKRRVGVVAWGRTDV